MIKNYLKLGLVLAAFAGAACVGLAFVNQATEKQIEISLEKQLSESLKELFPAAEAFDDITAELSWLDAEVKLEQAFVVKAAGAPIGVAVKASGPSYGGPAMILIGLGADKLIAGVKVLELKDTPGLGANAAVPTYFVGAEKKSTFPGQFKGRAVDGSLKVKQDGGAIDAITASTITSRAIAKIIKAAGEAAGARLAAMAGGN